MADQLYGYSSIYGSAATSAKAAAAAAAASSRYHQLASTSADTTPYSSFASSLYFPKSKTDDSYAYSTADAVAASYYSSEYDHLASSVKRSSQALYNPSIYGAQSTDVQSEAWYDPLSKRPRFDCTSNLPIYPQRPGEKDCAHYMLTRTCKFGYSCRFDHPIWVPEGGIPDWKEVPLVATPEALPERPGEPDCPYFVKTQRCKYGSRCRFNHPRTMTTSGSSENFAGSSLPQRPSEQPCAFYMKTGICKFGATCKFHHPPEILALKSDQQNGGGKQSASLHNVGGTLGDVNLVTPFGNVSPAPLHNTKGLPMRPGEADCPFYLKTGSCKYGATCRYNHPDWTATTPAVAALISSATLSGTPLTSLYQVSNPAFAAMSLGVGSAVYPQRPGMAECDYYMKTGICKFGESCKYDHPVNRTLQTTTATTQTQESPKLTLAGLPRREGSISCPYYMKTGVCKFGVSCKFDHPPPGEVAGMAASQVPEDASATATAAAEEAKEEEAKI